jgi:hypothetical protein
MPGDDGWAERRMAPIRFVTSQPDFVFERPDFIEPQDGHVRQFPHRQCERELPVGVVLEHDALASFVAELFKALFDLVEVASSVVTKTE